MKLYLDDLRPLPDDSYDLARSYDEAIKYVKQNGVPDFISFDHDLGVDSNNNLLPTGYDFAKWLVEMDMNGTYTFSVDFAFFVHSANPVGKANIETYLNNYLEYKKENSENYIKKLNTKERYIRRFRDVQTNIQLLYITINESDNPSEKLSEYYKNILLNILPKYQSFDESTYEDNLIALEDIFKQSKNDLIITIKE